MRRWDKRKIRSILLLALVLFILVAILVNGGKGKRIQVTLPLIKEEPEVNLYFASKDDSLLVAEKRELVATSNILEAAKLLIEGLISGPETNGLIPTLPEGTRLRELYIASAVAYPDFTQELIKNHWGGTSGEVQTVYSIVNTLGLNFDQIKMVQILVEGKEIPSLAGHIDTSRPLAPDISLIKRVENKEKRDEL